MSSTFWVNLRSHIDTKNTWQLHLGIQLPVLILLSTNCFHFNKQPGLTDPCKLLLSECVGLQRLRCHHLQSAAEGSARHNPTAICQTKMSAPGFRMGLICFLYECLRQHSYPLASHTTALYYTSSSGRLSEVIALKALLYIVQPDSMAYWTGCGCGGGCPGELHVYT